MEVVGVIYSNDIIITQVAILFKWTILTASEVYKVWKVWGQNMNEKHKLLELVKAIKKEPSNDKKWEILIKWLDIFMTKL